MKKKMISILICLFAISRALVANEITTVQFKNWWLSFRETSTIPRELKLMEDYYISSPLLSETSKYWLFLNKKNIEQITNFGFENFKQTVACNYFTWLVEGNHGYSKNLYKDGTDFLNTLPRSELTKRHSLFTAEQSYQYNQTTALLYYFLMKNGGGPYLEQLEESKLGNPPTITIQGKVLSQDILNSLLEYLSVARNYDISNVSTILEIGAGSGRTAQCYMQLMPHVKYIIVDIPPALYLSQTFLSGVFSNRKIFYFRPFEKFDDIKDEFLAADLIFITPDQMRRLPDYSVDLFLAIDCLHEMKRDEVQFYFNEVNRLASLFYYKCWTNTVVPYDNIPYRFQEYPVKPTWRKIFEGGCFIPSDFSHALYVIH